MTEQEEIIIRYIADAHARGGGVEMAMLMMAQRIIALEDAAGSDQLTLEDNGGDE